MNQSRSHRRSARGFTLLELMVTIAIIVIINGLGVSAFTQIFSEELRTETNRVAATVRHAYNRSVAEGLYVRMVFSPGTGNYRVEASAEQILIDPNASQLDEDKDQDDDEGQPPGPSYSALMKIEPMKGAIISGVITMSQPEEITEGEAYIHFSPADLWSMKIRPTKMATNTLIVNPMTGIARMVSRPDSRFGEPDRIERKA